jgi:hypothetical protein
MKHLRALLSVLSVGAATALFAACGTNGTGGTGSSSGQGNGGSGGSAVACPPCTQDSDCAPGSKCGQFGGATYCAPDCSAKACSADRACTPVNGFDGSKDQLCLPTTNVCGSLGAGGSGGSGGSGTTTATSVTSSSSSSSGVITGTVGPKGGTLSSLNFVVVGDTRPATEDDTAHYPTAIATKIWKDVDAFEPRPSFGITTGDYMFAKPTGSQSLPQMVLYLKARANFSNVVFPVLGNHECTGGDASECGTGNPNGVTHNYTTFMNEMMTPLGQALPYYAINVSDNATPSKWTAKFVFIACNAWTAKQSTWLTTELSKPTTYTFVVRHEGTTATTVPCIKPTGTILAAHPYTLLIAGHTHTYAYHKSLKEVIVGNGGAPLSGNVDYGYLIAQQQANGDMLFKEYDYNTNTLESSFTVPP